MDCRMRLSCRDLPRRADGFPVLLAAFLCVALVSLGAGEPAAGEAGTGASGIRGLLDKYRNALAEAPKPPANARIVHFPKDRPLGSLLLMDDDAPHPSILNNDSPYESFGTAVGDVAVPRGKRLILQVAPNQCKDLSPLSLLEPDALYSIHLSGSESGGPKVDDACIRHLRGLTGLRQLHTLDTAVTEEALRHISQLKSLNYLQLSSSSLGDSAMPYLAEMTSLETLVLGAGRVTDDGLKHLQGLTRLKELYVWLNNVRGPGLTYLSKLPQLEFLLLAGDDTRNPCKFTDAGLQYLRDIPSIRKLRLHRWLPVGDAGMPHLGALTQLELLDLGGRPITDAGFAHLKDLRSLKTLELGGTKTTVASLTYIKQFKSLESLMLPFELSDAELAVLGELHQLKRLNIGGTFTDAGVKHLTALKSLEKLWISSGNIGNEGVAYIAALPNLRFLFLRAGRSVTDEALAKLETLKSLNTLSIYGANITFLGLKHLNALSRLTELRVHDLRQDGSGLDISGLSMLEDLTLMLEDGSAFRDQDLACLTRLTRLRVLQLSHNGIGDAGLAHLAGLTSLWLLSVGGEGVTDDGLAHLANMQRLTTVVLSGKITDKGLRHLEKLKALSTVEFLKGATLSRAALDAFKRKMPNLAVLRDYSTR